MVAHLDVLDHDNRVGATRDHPSGGDRHGRPAPDDGPRHDTGVNRFFGKLHAARPFFGRAKGVVGDDGEAVHVRTIEGRHIDRRDNVS